MSNKKRSIITVIVLFLSTITLFSLVLPVNAITYQFITNGGFEDIIGGNKITTGNFESGDSDGMRNSGGTYYSGSLCTAHSPTTVWYGNGAGDYVEYNFTTPIPVGNVQTFGIWTNKSAGFRIRCIYTDGSFLDGATVDVPDVVGWVHINLLSNIYGNFSFIEGKLIKSFHVETSGAPVWIDDWYLTTYIQGQTTISQTTKPWYYNGYANSVQQLGAINQTSGFAHSGNCTYQESYGYLVTTPLGGTSTTSSIPMVIWQDLLNPVYTDNVTDFSLWARTEDYGAYQLTGFFIYSDGYIGQKQVNFNAYNQWVSINFTSGLLPNKILKTIGFQMTGGTIAVNTGDHGGHYYLYIDDITLTTNVPVTQTTLTWTMRPTPLWWNTYSFTQLTGVAESFTYYVYNFGGELTENGTAIITTSYGTINTTVLNGVFSFSTSARPTGTNITEFITSQIILEDRTIVHSLEAEWVTLPTTTSTPSTDIDEDSVTQGANTTVYLGGGLLIVLALSLTFGAIAGKDGLLTGIVIGTFLASITGLFPIYGLIFAVIVGAILVVSHTGIPNTSGGTT